MSGRRRAWAGPASWNPAILTSTATARWAASIWDTIRISAIVLGVELQYNLANIEFDSGDPDNTINSLAHLKLRGGYDTGATLFYGAIGLADAEADGGASGSGSLYGLGIEHRFSERLSGGVEYLVHEFDDFYSDGIDLEVQTLQARVSLHF